jgi:hypothetical protein
MIILLQEKEMKQRMMKKKPVPGEVNDALLDEESKHQQHNGHPSPKTALKIDLDGRSRLIWTHALLLLLHSVRTGARLS